MLDALRCYLPHRVALNHRDRVGEVPAGNVGGQSGHNHRIHHECVDIESKRYVALASRNGDRQVSEPDPPHGELNATDRHVEVEGAVLSRERPGC